MRIAALAAAVVLCLTPGLEAQAPVVTAIWASKPRTPPPYPPGHRPWIRLDALKAAHRGEAGWRETVVDDGRLVAEYVAAPPGAVQSARFHPDTREWFAVVEGEVRVEIERQPPFVARRGSLVNVPRQTVFTVTTIGTAPSLRFVLNVAGAQTFFLADGGTPPAEAAPAGAAWLRATISRLPGRYDESNVPTLNIRDEAAGNPEYRGGRFVRDDKSEMLVLYGHERNLPPLDPADKGHFHAASAEAWLVFAGKIRYAFEGQTPFVASEGDVVYVPAGTWHATRFVGDDACRLSITEYVGNTLVLEPRPPVKPAGER